MPSGAAVLGDRPIGRQEALRMPCCLQPLHTALALTWRPLGVLTPILERAALTVLYAREAPALGRAIALQLIGEAPARPVGYPLEHLAKALLRRVLMAAALHQDIEDSVVLIHRAPQVMARAMEREQHLIQVPLIARARPPPPQPIGVVLPHLPPPWADRFVGHREAAFEPECFHVAVAQGEARGEPDPVADDFAGKAVVLVAFTGGGRGHGGLPSLEFEWAGRNHHQGNDVMGQEAGSTS
jgi:hypothetical protein